MKVKELIEHLLTFDQELDIVVNGYEGGVTEDVSIETAIVVCDVHQEWYYGEHEIDDEFHQDINKEQPRKSVIHISRNLF